MSIDTISPLRQRMIEDMNARKLCAATQTGHIYSCKRFAAFLKRSPDTATAEDIRLLQLHLIFRIWPQPLAYQQYKYAPKIVFSKYKLNSPLDRSSPSSGNRNLS